MTGLYPGNFSWSDGGLTTVVLNLGFLFQSLHRPGCLRGSHRTFPDKLI